MAGIMIQLQLQMPELDSSWLERLEAGFDFSDLLSDGASDGVHKSCNCLIWFAILLMVTKPVS